MEEQICLKCDKPVRESYQLNAGFCECPERYSKSKQSMDVNYQREPMTTQPRKTASQMAIDICRVIWTRANDHAEDVADKDVALVEKSLESYLLQESGELVEALEPFAKAEKTDTGWKINGRKKHPLDEPLADQAVKKAQEALNNFRSRHKQLWLGSQEKES